MNNKDQDIRYLWQQFVAKKASSAEIDKLFEAFQDPTNNEKLLSFIEGFFGTPVVLQEMDKQYWLEKVRTITVNDTDLRKEENKLSKTGDVAAVGQPLGRLTTLKTSRTLNNFKWWAVAAALAIVAGTMVLITRTSKPKKEISAITVQANDAAPGSNKATLTLDNGKAILLDSAHLGLLAHQGNATITKTDSGTLSYAAGMEKISDNSYNLLSIPRGGQYKLKLSDGTNVWLNSASSIKYPTVFAGKDRTVDITGEAYFEVAKDQTKPFNVRFKTNEGNLCQVEVLGTHFNINSYSDEQTIKTTLLEGSIRMTIDRGQEAGLPRNGKTIQAKVPNDQSIILKPGQQVQLSALKLETGKKLKEQLSVVNNPDIEEVMAWKNGTFHFDRANLAAVMRQLSRWYDVDVVYEKNIPDIKFGGEIKRDLNLSDVLVILGKMEVHFKIEGKKLIVEP